MLFPRDSYPDPLLVFCFVFNTIAEHVAIASVILLSVCVGAREAPVSQRQHHLCQTSLIIYGILHPVVTGNNSFFRPEIGKQVNLVLLVTSRNSLLGLGG